MALSNTECPYYYGQFRDAVLKGEIPVCEEISLEMNRIDGLIANPSIYYDKNAVEGFIAYCENELTLTDGSDLVLLDTFKLWAEQIFGWYYFTEISVYHPELKKYVQKYVKKRLVTIQYLIIARSAAKSLYGSCIQSFFLNVDKTTTHQITTAPTMKQAEEIMSPIKTSIVRSRGPLMKFLTEGNIHNTTGSKALQAKLASTKKGIENRLTGSLLEIRPMSIDKLQGLRVKCATVDEWLSGDIKEDVIGTIEQGAAKGNNADYLILAMSSEGTTRNGVGDSIKMELYKILRGEYYNPHVSIWYYRLDSLSEINDPPMWLKAQPNLGKTVQWETYHQEVEKAEHSPSARNDILAKRFGIPMEGTSYFFTYEETLAKEVKKDYWQQPCAMGADLSQGDDFCAFTFLFPLPQGLFGIKVRSYITETTMIKLAPAMRKKYEEFLAEGTLVIMPGSILNMNEVYEDLSAFIDSMKYDVQALGYDPYNAREFITQWEIDNGPFGIEKVKQGVKTESVPLGEIKKLAEDGLLYFDEKLMQFAMGNCIALEDTNGNRKLYKRRREEKIDNVAALLDAFVAYKLNKDLFG